MHLEFASSRTVTRHIDHCNSYKPAQKVESKREIAQRQKVNIMLY